MRGILSFVLPALLLLNACGASPGPDVPAAAESVEGARGAGAATGSAPTAPVSVPPVPGQVIRGDSSTNLDTTPISAADYAMYAAIMAGASAMLSTLTPADKDALALAKRVNAGAARATPGVEGLLAQASALQQKDMELARLQGVDARYLKVKATVEAAIGPNAKTPAAGDWVGLENLRYLEAHRAAIERFQRILRDPLSKVAEGGQGRLGK